MRKAFFLISSILLLVAFLGASDCIQAKAANVRGSQALGGYSEILSNYIEAGGELYDQDDLQLLAAAMELENGCNSDECLLLTGSVILNRAYYCEWAPDTIRDVLYQPGQYASHTVNNLTTVSISSRVYELAKQLLIYGPLGPRNMVYQAQFPQGKLYKHVDTEYFGLE